MPYNSVVSQLSWYCLSVFINVFLTDDLPNRASRHRHRRKMVDTQTSIADGDLAYRWDERFIGRPIVPPSLGLGSVDPSPIATHVVNADTLESEFGSFYHKRVHYAFKFYCINYKYEIFVRIRTQCHCEHLREPKFVFFFQ